MSHPVSNRSESRQPLSAVALIMTVLAPFAAGYFLSYLFRSVNAVIAPDLVADIGLTAAELGLLTSAYLLGFGLFQLPLGVVLDRYGPRRVQTVFLCCAAVGSLLFAWADSLSLLIWARGLIGLGFAGGLMSGFKAVVLWVPAPRRALANACIMSFGALGILVATVPVELAVQVVGWRAVFLVLAGVTFAVAALIFTLVPESPAPVGVQAWRAQVGSAARIFRDRAFLRLAPLLAITAGTHIAIQTLWAGPWFRDVMGLTREGVAGHLMALAVAFLVGILFSGVLADWMVRRGVDLLTVMIGFIVVFLCAELAIVMQWTGLGLIPWFAYGMSGQAAILAYPWLSTYFGTALSGRANTAMNLVIFLTAFLVQYAIGEVIDLFPTSAAGGYDPRGYQVGFGIFLALQAIALAWYLVGRRAAGPPGPHEPLARTPSTA